MIAFIVPRREAGAAGGLPDLEPWVRLAGYDRLVDLRDPALE